MTNPAPGFYDDGRGTRRWWNGQAWTEHLDVPAQSAPVLANDGRAEILNREVARYVTRGYTVETADGRQAVLSRRVPMSFVLNLIGVLLTGGLWLIYILVRIGSPQFERRVVTVDGNGVVNGALPASSATGAAGAGERSGLTVFGFVLSGLAFLFSFSGVGGLVFGVPAAVMLMLDMQRKSTRLGLTGLILAAAAVVIAIVVVVARGLNGS